MNPKPRGHETVTPHGDARKKSDRSRYTFIKVGNKLDKTDPLLVEELEKRNFIFISASK